MNNLLKKIALFLGCISLMQISIHAQNEIDALRFSEIDWQGSARFMGAGKAFGAVGGEFSALNINPAGIGLYKKSEVTFTPMTLSIYKNNSTYNGSSVSAQAVKYNVGSVGVVFALPGISSTLWKKFQIGYGFNRIKNYNNTFFMEGNNFIVKDNVKDINDKNCGTTIGSVFALEANGLDYINVDNWASDEAWFAWESYLINPLVGSNSLYVPALLGRDLSQSSTITRSGGNDEMIFSFGTNYDDKLFLGATIGVPFINFTEKRTYTETLENPLPTDTTFRSMTITDKLSVRSTGINFKLGIIYQPADFVRLGVAFHTPTYYGNVKDNFDREMFAQLRDYKVSVPYSNLFNYSLITPLRATANVAFFIAQRAFISAEYEFANYGMASMYSDSYSFRDENNAIKDMYGFSHIARIGAEVNLSQILALRVGYNYISSPYKDKINDGSQHYASAGFGFRTKYFFGDFAYAFNLCKEKYWMYNPAFVNATDNKYITHRIMLTLGVRF